MIRRDFTVMQGSDHVEWIPDLDGRGNAPQRAGWTATAVVRHTPDGPLVAALDARFGPGRVEVTIPGSLSAGWAWRRSRYQVKLEGPQGKLERFAAGRIVLDPQL